MMEFYYVFGFLEPNPRNIWGDFQGVRVHHTTFAIDKKHAAERVRTRVCTDQRWKNAKWKHPPDIASQADLQKRENNKYLRDAIAFQKGELGEVCE